jgi:16S rRNA (cytosine1402-N4)-methyltransferase
MTDGAVHVPVMMSQVLEYLAPTPGNRYIDCTLGLGGHSEAVLERSAPDGELLGLDADPAALALARARLEVFGQRVVLVQANFDRLEAQARAHGFVDVDGVLFDLGVSSLQLGLSGRGFTFRASEPLDMRMDPTSGPTAADLLATLTERELADLIYQYGEDRASRRIARSIVYHRERRALETTDDLVGAIISAVGGQRGRIHPATRTFSGAAHRRQPRARGFAGGAGTGAEIAAFGRAARSDLLPLPGRPNSQALHARTGVCHGIKPDPNHDQAAHCPR